LPLAYRECLKSEHRARHGALIRKGSRYSVGYNKQANHPGICWPDDNSIHAEHDAIRKHTNPDGGVMYSVRLNQRLYPAIAKPCDRCAQFSIEAGIKRIIYTDPSSITGYSELKL